MARHSKQRRFSVITHDLHRHGHADACLDERRTPGAAWEHHPADPKRLAQGAPDEAVLRTFLEAMYRWRMEDSDELVPVTRDTVERTAALVLSKQFDPVADGEAEHTVRTLRGFLLALADSAESDLDPGRVVVREVVKRARAMADAPLGSSRRDARRAAKTLLDVLTLLEREGWGQAASARKEAAGV